MDRVFIVYGQPKGKGRPRFTRYGHAFTPDSTRQYEQTVRDAYYREYGSRTKPYEKETPLIVDIDAYFQMPKSWSAKKKGMYDMKKHTQKPDLDNIAKIVLDALNGVVFSDDSQIAYLRVRKYWCLNEPCVEVRIEEE